MCGMVCLKQVFLSPLQVVLRFGSAGACITPPLADPDETKRGKGREDKRWGKSTIPNPFNNLKYLYRVPSGELCGVVVSQQIRSAPSGKGQHRQNPLSKGEKVPQDQTRSGSRCFPVDQIQYRLVRSNETPGPRKRRADCRLIRGGQA